MATIKVENGTIVADANSYITVAELDTYATDRGITILAADDAAKGELLIKAMDYIEDIEFIGLKRTEDQSLQWPRFDVVIDGYWIDLEEIPKLLKEAQASAALDIDRSIDPLQDLPRATSKEKVDVLEVEYKDSSSSLIISRRINSKLRKLKVNQGGVNRA